MWVMARQLSVDPGRRVNCNHPLAAQNLLFEVQIIEVKRETDEIIRMGT